MTEALEAAGLCYAPVPQGAEILRGVSLRAEPGELLCLLGPSGAGKSTVLRVLAGLTRPQAGSVRLGERVLAQDGGSHVPPEGRRIGIVFQELALFPHLSVRGNIAFGLHGKASAQAARVDELLSALGLHSFAQAFPDALSGGQKQRVALARALAPQPAALVLDEPFSGLDGCLRDAIREEIFPLLKAQGTPVVLVTHDADEALRHADKIVLMRDGLVEQDGTPEELYFHPRSAFAMRFFGECNEVQLQPAACAASPLLMALRLRCPGSADAERLLFRPEAIVLAHQRVPSQADGSARRRYAQAAADPRLEFEAAPTEVRRVGASVLCRFTHPDLGAFQARFPGYGASPACGEALRLAFDPRYAARFQEDGVDTAR